MLDRTGLAFVSEHLKFWGELTPAQREDAAQCGYSAALKKGRRLSGTDRECLGLVLVESGQLRAFINSGEGREIGLYRLLSLDCCIMSAACAMRNLSFDIHVEIEKDALVHVIPSVCFNRLREQSPAVNGFALELISARFSEVMWVFDQYVFGTAAGRLAAFLIEQSGLEQSDTLRLTHEQIANDIGTAREVVTRLLGHFSQEGLVSLSRGAIKIEQKRKLAEL